MVRAFRRLGHEVWPYAKVYHEDRWWSDWYPDDVDLLLRMECGDEETQYPELARLDCSKVYWTFDVARYPAREGAIADHLRPDLVLCGNARYAPPRAKTFNGFKVRYLPYAVDPDHFHPCTCPHPRHGAAIVGTPFPERAAFAGAAGLSLVRSVNHEDYARLLRGLKVHVHYHASGGQGLLVMRPWETMGSGTLLLTEEDETHALHPDIPWLTYKDAADCGQQVQGYLEHEHLQRNLAAAQHRAVMANHTYLHRAQAILDMLG